MLANIGFETAEIEASNDLKPHSALGEYGPRRSVSHTNVDSKRKIEAYAKDIVYSDCHTAQADLLRPADLHISHRCNFPIATSEEL